MNRLNEIKDIETLIKLKMNELEKDQENFELAKEIAELEIELLEIEEAE